MSYQPKTPEEIEATNRFLNYTRGWRDGARGQVAPRNASTEYTEGHKDGRKAKGEAFLEASKRFSANTASRASKALTLSSLKTWE